MTIYKARAPLRIGLAGGGTDIKEFYSKFGGAVLNATINLYAHASLKPLSSNKIILYNGNSNKKVIFSDIFQLLKSKNDNPDFILAIGCIKYLYENYDVGKISFEITTYVDCPPGSGLGSSSTLTVALVGLLFNYFNIESNRYEIAEISWYIERIKLKQSGGKQDQYAATFGGFNFIEFNKHNVLVNNLNLSQKIVCELETNLVLFFTNTNRYSAKIIKNQINSVKKSVKFKVNSFKKIKSLSFELKESLQKDYVKNIGKIFHESWILKKQTSEHVSNKDIDGIYEAALKNGATGGKVSGAGGGGFIFFYCPDISKYKLISSLNKFNLIKKEFSFCKDGLTTWEI